MQVKQLPHTMAADQSGGRAAATVDAEVTEQPARAGAGAGQIRRGLTWSALTLAVMIALALAMVLAGLAAAPADPAPPPPTAPMQFGPSMGPAKAE
jgi:hypothetical protein